MKKRTVVTICDMEFSLIGEENEEYTKKVAEHVDKRMREVSSSVGISTLDAAVLTAINIADDYFRQVDSAENMRSQLKDYFDELSRLKDENAELKRELNKLRNTR
ncbi:MAG: cell division protein ZapA [Clostridiales bacterium]|jgi:cell division protein ZapA|nr:cell division protein ZapA [Clostridiales bacterium]